MLDKARSLLNAIETDPDSAATGANWKSLHVALKKAPCDQMRLARYIATRDIPAMKKVLSEVASAPPPAPRGGPAAVGADGAPLPRPAPPPLIQIRAEKPTAQQLKTALAAFKKRMKLTKLDQESRLGRSPMTGGAKSNIVAILPPNLYPKVYWEELEKQGQIRNTGGGFYELVEKAKPIRSAAPAAAAEGEITDDAGAAPEASADDGTAADDLPDVEVDDQDSDEADSEQPEHSA